MKAVDTLGTVGDVDTDALRDALSSFPVDIVVLFGSVARGEEGEISDIDIAVRFEQQVGRDERLALLDEMTAAVIDAAGFSAVDLVDLDRVPPRLGYRALDTGLILIGDEEAVIRLKERFLARKLDFQPVTAMWQEALLDRMEGAAGGS